MPNSRTLKCMLFPPALGAFERCDDTADQARCWIKTQIDPDDWRRVRANTAGACYVPLTICHHQRTSARERVLKVATKFPDRLTIELYVLATRVVFGEE